MATVSRVLQAQVLKFTIPFCPAKTRLPIYHIVARVIMQEVSKVG